MTASGKDKAGRAALYRMVMPDHLCPYGLKSKELLEREGYEVEDHHLRTREEVEAFMQRHEVETTPQSFIEGERIGGHDALRAHFGKARGFAGAYQPVVALFTVAALMALAVGFVSGRGIFSVRVIEWFVAIAMVLLGLQKLKDVESFSTMFLNYDLLARRYVPYSYVYPFAETGAGVLMIAGVLTLVSAPVALFIGLVGAASVFKAVYIDRRELKCACVGGDSEVPLGFVSLTENLMMTGMGIWMLAKVWGGAA